MSSRIVEHASVAGYSKKIRVSEHLTRKELACMAGVQGEDVDKIENGIPLQLETKLKILRVLYSNKLLH